MEYIDLAQILIDLSMNRKEFVDFCILMGCDFSAKIPKMGTQILIIYRNYFI
jgi:hypothetical protein